MAIPDDSMTVRAPAWLKTALEHLSEEEGGVGVSYLLRQAGCRLYYEAVGREFVRQYGHESACKLLASHGSHRTLPDPGEQARSGRFFFFFV